MNPQLKKGILDLCALQLVRAGGEIYGYDLMKKMAVYFPEVNESTFYAVLRRLHQGGLTETVSRAGSNGPPRKYYRITPAGRTWLAENAAEWRRLAGVMEALGL